MSNLLEVLISG